RDVVYQGGTCLRVSRSAGTELPRMRDVRGAECVPACSRRHAVDLLEAATEMTQAFEAAVGGDRADRYTRRGLDEHGEHMPEADALDVAVDGGVVGHEGAVERGPRAPQSAHQRIGAQGGIVETDGHEIAGIREGFPQEEGRSVAAAARRLRARSRAEVIQKVHPVPPFGDAWRAPAPGAPDAGVQAAKAASRPILCCPRACFSTGRACV